jgi:hypothetical protein
MGGLDGEQRRRVELALKTVQIKESLRPKRYFNTTIDVGHGPRR